MPTPAGSVLLRLAPLLLLVVIAGAWIADVQANGPYVLRNLVPPLVVVLLGAIVLGKNGGRWRSSDWRWPLATLGFAIPAIGLSLYLHYAYAVNLDGLFDEAKRPAELFRFLPIYTLVAGLLGFAIGWIIGRNV